MQLDALLLFGSYARGDFDADSDIDLLGIGGSVNSKQIVSGRLAFSVFPMTFLEKLVREHSLFLWHLVREAVVLTENGNAWKNITSKFELKTSYHEERQVAALTGWAMLSDDAWLRDPVLAAKTVHFAVRTVCISLLAERDDPAFSRKAIAEKFSTPDVLALIGVRYTHLDRAMTVKFLPTFLRTYGMEGAPVWLGQDLEVILKDPMLGNTYARKRLEEFMGRRDAKESGYQ